MNDRDLKQSGPNDPRHARGTARVADTTDGANAHGIGPDTDGGPNPHYQADGQAVGGIVTSDATNPNVMTYTARHGFTADGRKRPPREGLLYVLDQAEMTERHQKEDDARKKLAAIEKAKLLGAKRRRQALQSLVFRMANDIGGTADFASAVLSEFDVEVATDDEQTGQAQDDGNITFRLKRPGWPDIRMAVAFKDADEPDARFASYPWSVHPREAVATTQNDHRVYVMQPLESHENYYLFGLACLAAGRHAMSIAKIAAELTSHGKEVRWL